jgi:polar amino acid transport system substrate-binding protein
VGTNTSDDEYCERVLTTKNLRYGALAALVILGSIGIFLTWRGINSTGSNALARIRGAGTIRIGYAVEAPYIYFDKGGRLTGLEYDTSQVIASRMDIAQVEWVQTDFGELIPDLQEGRFDLISSGMFITSERARLVDFSEPVFHVRLALLVAKGNPYGLHSYEDVRSHPGVKVAVLGNSIEQSMMKQLGVADERIVRVPDALTGRAAVESGVADCMALSLPSVQRIVLQQALGTAEIAEPFSQPLLPGIEKTGYGAAAFRKQDTSLRDAWNRELARFIGSPEHLAILAKYGFSPKDLPGNSTSESILATGTP